MIWRLTYCNKKGVEARIDIIKGDRTSVEIVQGSGNPFTLSYKLDKNDKSGHIMTSSADIEFFETEEFNIDKLKTSNETELKVEYFEDNVLTWSGFILPDFFSREIGSPNIVRMTASDRLTALKGVTLRDLPSRVSLRNLIELSLGQTGLSLGLVSQIQINQGSTNILDSEILSQRLTDVRGRSISCYDILMSIMVATNSTIRQRKGQWQIYNKLEHELRTPTIFFDKVERGAIRTIQPVASSVGVYQEYGGGRLHPDNYDFAQGGSGWVTKNGFSYTISNQKPVSYSVGVPNHTVTFGESDRNRMMIMGIVLPFWKPDTAPHVENKFPVITSNEDSVKITIDISVLGWGYWGSGSTGRFIILAENDNSRLAFNPNSGHFEEFDNQAISPNSSEPPYVIKLRPSANKVGDTFPITSKSVKYETVLEKANLSGYTISIRIYRTSGFTGPTAPLFINFANIRFSNTEEAPRGTLFKTTQGSNFTKLHDVETTIFGDYITSGLNGYFYNYSIDDTSNLYLPSGELSPPTWETIFDTTERPLLHHVSRQKSRLFSVAHDILKANINVESFDHLAVFQDCKGGKYVVVSASFDFLRSEVDVELEQIAYDDKILKRDYIYSYFGEGEDTIKSIGGIAGGGGGTGGGAGGMTSEQLEMLTNLADWWKLDEENDAIYSEKSVYSLKGVSALGLGSGGGGSGGGGAEMLDSWANYTPAKANYYVPASLLVPFRNDTKSRLDSLEAGGGAIDIEIATTGSGNAITSLTKSGSVITANKGLTFALASHTHTIAQITGLQGALDLKASQSDITTAIDSIEIGGRNYISGNGSYSIRASRFINIPITTPLSGQLTLSGSRFVIQGSSPYSLVRLLDSDGNAIQASPVPAIRGEGLWSDTFSISTLAYTLQIYAGENYAKSNGVYVDLTKLKLEKGNKATDWSPAPEDQVDLTTNQSIGGVKTFNSHLQINGSTVIDGNTLNIFLSGNRAKIMYGENTTSDRKVAFGSGWGTIDDFAVFTKTSGSFSAGTQRFTVKMDGNVGIGTTNPLYKLDVSGTGRFTGSLIAPKVDFGNGFTIEPSGTELVFKYNGVIKQRMLSTGTILATGGITALATS